MRAYTTSTPPPAGGRDDQTVRRLAEQACSLVAGACSTRVGVRTLSEIASWDPALLDAAADGCGQVDDADGRVGHVAAQLLRRAAAQIRLARRDPQTGSIRAAGWRSRL